MRVYAQSHDKLLLKIASREREKWAKQVQKVASTGKSHGAKVSTKSKFETWPS